jgi:class 3 adenylate cyclase
MLPIFTCYTPSNRKVVQPDMIDSLLLITLGMIGASPFTNLFKPFGEVSLHNTNSRFWRACGFVGLEEEEFRRRVIVVWLLASSAMGGATYATIYILFGYPVLANFTIVYLFMAMANLVFLLWTKNYPVFRFIHLGFYLVFPTCIHLIVGGYVDTSSVLVACWLGPLSAIIFAPRGTAKFFFGALIVVITAVVFIEYYRDQPELQVPRDLRIFMFGFNMIVTLSQSYFLMDLFLVKKEEVTQVLRAEKQRTEALLLNILPQETAIELIQTGQTKTRSYDSTSVLFTDFVNFTNIAANVSPEKLIEELDYYFREFDRIVERHGLEKIKTIGDSYMCAGGLPTPNDTHAHDAVQAGLDICRFVEISAAASQQRCGYGFAVRVGIHTGSVVAGVVGARKFAYDIWGDTVNLAARMEEKSQPNRVNISQSTYDLVKADFTCTHRGPVSIKHRGEVDMFFVEVG